MHGNRKNTKLIVIAAILMVVSIIGGFTSYYFFSKYQDLKKNPTIIAKEESKSLVEKVGLLMQLPKGEEPTIATVMDKDKIKSQPFFTNAKNGDKALLYVVAKKAILYRPSTNKVIEVAPIFTEGASTSTGASTTTPAAN